jgi:hypothetical protein
MALAAWTAITYLVPSRVRTTPSAQAVNHMGGSQPAAMPSRSQSVGGLLLAPARPAPVGPQHGGCEIRTRGGQHASAACAPSFRPVYDARDQAQQRGESQRRYPPDARN